MSQALGGVGPFGGPVVPSLIRTFNSTAPDTFNSTKSVTVANGVVSGNYLVVIIATTNQSTVSSKPSAAWTLVGSTTSTASKIFVYSKLADGTEGGTTLTWTFSGSCIATMHGFEFLAPAADIRATFATGTDDPPSHNTAGAFDHWFIQGAMTLANTTTCNANASGYENLIYTESSITNSASTGQVALATGRIFKNATATEDPPGFTWSGARTTPAAVTVSVR